MKKFQEYLTGAQKIVVGKTYIFQRPYEGEASRTFDIGEVIYADPDSPQPGGYSSLITGKSEPLFDDDLFLEIPRIGWQRISQ
jgi:hypothetical protein